jgi:hypothetical protein
MLGHASAAMTLDIYADLFDDDLDDVAARLDEVRANVKDCVRTGNNLIRLTRSPETATAQ